MGKFDKLAKFLGLAVEKYGDDAAKILEKVDSPELATSLKGAEKKQYRKALDEIYGSVEKRAADDFSIDVNKLKQAETKAKQTRSNLKFKIEEASPVSNRSGFESVPLGKDEYIVGDNIYWEGELVDSVDSRLGRSGPDGALFNRLKIYDRKSGKQIGSVPFEVKDDKIEIADKFFKETQGDDPMNRAWTYIDPNHRGKGVASAAYSGLENKYGLPMKPSETQTEAGRALWNKTPDLKDLRYNLNEAERDIADYTYRKENTQSILNRVLRENPNSERIPDLQKRIEGHDNFINKKYERIDQIRKEIALAENSSRPFGNARKSGAAFDPRFKDSPLLMAGALAAPMGKQVVDMNPLEDIKTGLGYYEKAKEVVSKPLASQLNISKNPQDEKFINEALKTGLDPVNFIPGPIGFGAGAIQMLTPSEEEMKRKVLEKMAKGEM